MEPVRILHVVGRMHPGGMETLIMNIYRNIDTSRVQFDFMVHYERPGEFDDEIRKMGGRIYVMPRTVPQNIFKYQRALKQFFSEHKEYRVIHGHLRSVALFYHSAAKKYGGAKCCIAHAHIAGREKSITGFFRQLNGRLSQKVTDCVLGCSSDAINYCFPEIVKAGKPVTIVKNGIECEKYAFSPEIRNEVRKELGVGDKYVIGHVGRFFEQKNHKYLIEVFEKICKTRDDCVLLLAGDGPLKNSIEQMCRDKGILEKVIFAGVRNDINRLMQGMDIFLFPSLYEGLGIVLIEAQAASLRCLSSDAVPKDAGITDLCEYLPLSDIDKWVSEAVKPCEDRKNMTRFIKNAGYDIHSTAKWLEDFYVSCF